MPKRGPKKGEGGRPRKGQAARVPLSTRVKPSTLSSIERLALGSGISRGEALDILIETITPKEEP